MQVTFLRLPFPIECVYSGLILRGGRGWDGCWWLRKDRGKWQVWPLHCRAENPFCCHPLQHFGTSLFGLLVQMVHWLHLYSKWNSARNCFLPRVHAAQTGHVPIIWLLTLGFCWVSCEDHLALRHGRLGGFFACVLFQFRVSETEQAL